MTNDKSTSLFLCFALKSVVDFPDPGNGLTEDSRILLSEEIPAKDFKGYFVARFSKSFKMAGISYAGKMVHALHGQGQELSGWVTFEEGTEEIDVRVGVSFISVDQARRYVMLPSFFRSLG